MKVCPVCEANGCQALESYALDVSDSMTMRYLRCAPCGITYLSDEIKTEDIDYSDSGYYQVEKPRFSYAIDIMMNMFMAVRLRFLRQCTESLEGKTVLDIGCGKGRFLYYAKKSGMKVLGLEPTKRSYIVARSLLGKCISNRAMESGVIPQSHVDIITMWHVFEHIPDPISMLKICKEALKPKGYLVISVPNFNGWIAKLGAGVWFNLDPPRHIVHYTPESLTHFLENNGFSVIYLSYRYPELTYFSALQTILNKFPISPNFLFNLLKRNEKAIPTRKIKLAKDVLITLTLCLLFFPLILTLVPLTTLLGKSDCFTVIVKKLV